MSRPFKHPKTGVYYARKAVPPELRPFLGGRWELKQTLGTKNPKEARQRHSDIMAEFETKLAAARAQRLGEVQSLSQREVDGLCGRWYRAELTRCGDNPGSAKYWSDLSSFLADYFVEEDEDDPHRVFHPDKYIRSETEALLASYGIAADRPTLHLMAERWTHNRITLAGRMCRRANGDWSEDSHLATFPPDTIPPPKVAYGTAPDPADRLTFEMLLSSLAAERNPPRKTQDKRVALFARFASLIGHDDPRRVTKADVRRWKEHRLAAGVRTGKTPRPASPKTVDDDIGMMRAVLAWGLDNGLLSGDNPFARMGVRVARGAAKRLPFSDEEAAGILLAARQAQGGKQRGTVAQLRGDQRRNGTHPEA